MNTNTIRRRVVTGAIGAALVGAAAPALMFLWTASAHAAAVTPDGGQHAAATTTQRPGHVAIHVEPAPVSPPLVWGAHSSPIFIVGD